VSATRFDLVTIDAANAPVVVSFWEEALALEVVETEHDGRWTVLGTSGRRVLGVQRVEGLDQASPTWSGPEKARIHLDLACDFADFECEVERLLMLGATRLRDDRREPYGMIATLSDPEGNIFDLCAYER
jgi:predicted enzyme related to lactoylglutathione lyase